MGPLEVLQTEMLENATVKMIKAIVDYLKQLEARIAKLEQQSI